ncbi:hypothetical protein B0H10DRAFT_1953167 [Mycena sp. CBHHK59/15]|nr:hypothetical protein B0H10DRAFT_1953167 [Mycena sp. CBHHK59/15]
MAKSTGIGEDEGDEAYYPVWENEINSDNPAFVRDTRATRNAKQIIFEASSAGFYSVQNLLSSDICEKFSHRSGLGDEDDVVKASLAAKNLDSSHGPTLVFGTKISVLICPSTYSRSWTAGVGGSGGTGKWGS